MIRLQLERVARQNGFAESEESRGELLHSSPSPPNVVLRFFVRQRLVRLITAETSRRVDSAKLAALSGRGVNYN